MRLVHRKDRRVQYDRTGQVDREGQPYYIRCRFYMFCWLFLVIVRERPYIFVNIWGEMVIPFLGCSFART